MILVKNKLNTLLYWFFWEPRKKFFRFFYCSRNWALHSKADYQSGVLDVFIIAYNKPQLITENIKRLKELFAEPFNLIIVDNSDISAQAAEILRICKIEKIEYFRIKTQKRFTLSASHSLAMNWTYKKIIKNRRPKYFGFLDHDLFPISNVSLTDKLESQTIYGAIHYAINKLNKKFWEEKTPQYWYLWAGFCFFNYDKVQNVKVNFDTLVFEENSFDTGGANYISLYKNMDKSNIAFARIQFITVLNKFGVQRINNNWIHIGNGSYWRNDGFEYDLELILNEFEGERKSQATSNSQ